MNWENIGQGVNDALCCILVVRLLTLRLHRVYRVFCAFLAIQLLGSIIDIVEKNLARDEYPDYRITWIFLQIALCVLSLWMVYALLKAVLAGLPGILRFSRNLLNGIFITALGVALYSARAEYGFSKAVSFLTPLGRMVGVTLILDRAVCTAALIALLAILCFILWFPVSMPKNLAVFSIGFAIYFAAIGASLLTWSLNLGASVRFFDAVGILILSLCSLYWTIFITAEGEALPVRIGHSWDPAERRKLMSQLEAMNATMAGASRRGGVGPLIPSTPQR